MRVNIWRRAGSLGSCQRVVALNKGRAMMMRVILRWRWAVIRPRHEARLASGTLVVAACAFHGGGETIAFLRGGELWSINPDGSGAAWLAGGGVVGFAWSPDHHQVVFRSGNGAFAASS